MIKVVLYLYRTGPSVSWTMRRVSRPLRLMGRRSLARRSFWQQRPARSSRGSRQIPYSLGLGPCDGLSDGRMCSASACSSASWARRVGRVRLGGSRSPKRRKNGKLQSKYGDSIPREPGENTSQLEGSRFAAPVEPLYYMPLVELQYCPTPSWTENADGECGGLYWQPAYRSWYASVWLRR